MTEIANQQPEFNQSNYIGDVPRTIIIYKTYTQAVKRAQAKYRMTDKGKEARLKAGRAFRARHRERIRQKNSERVSCPHCGCVYCRAYLSRHIKKEHN